MRMQQPRLLSIYYGPKTDCIQAECGSFGIQAHIFRRTVVQFSELSCLVGFVEYGWKTKYKLRMKNKEISLTILIN